MVGIVEPSVALWFDLRCGELLLEFENEREQLRLEAMGAGMVNRSLTGNGVTRDGRHPALTGAQVGEITAANFRDQGF